MNALLHVSHPGLKTMELYHGTTLVIQEPRIFNRFKTLDFGTGFYTTSNEDQAQEFAKKAFERRGRIGKPTVNAYSFDSSALDTHDLAVLAFDGPNEDWLNFVVHNRKFGRNPELAVDLVIGPVANDNVFRTIDLFESGELTASEAIERFKVNELFNQYLFCNERALARLNFSHSYEVV